MTMTFDQLTAFRIASLHWPILVFISERQAGKLRLPIFRSHSSLYSEL